MSKLEKRDALKCEPKIGLDKQDHYTRRGVGEGSLYAAQFVGVGFHSFPGEACGIYERLTGNGRILLPGNPYYKYKTGCPRIQNSLFSTNGLRRAGGPRPYLDNKESRGIRDYSEPVFICQGRGAVPAPAYCRRVLGQPQMSPGGFDKKVEIKNFSGLIIRKKVI